MTRTVAPRQPQAKYMPPLVPGRPVAPPAPGAFRSFTRRAILWHARSCFGAYAVAIAVSLAVILVKWAVPFLGAGAPFLLSSLPIMVAAWFCGMRPALVSLALIVIGNMFLFQNNGVVGVVVNAENVVQSLAFIFQGLLVDLMVGYGRAALERSEANLTDALDTEQRMLAEMDALPLLLFTAEPDGRPDTINARWIEKTGVKPSEDLLADWFPLIHDEDRERIKEAYFTAIRTGVPWDDEYRLRHADGSYCWYLVRAVPIRNKWGAIFKWFGALTDINANKKNQEVLLREVRVRDDFLAMLAHELRNPLGPILNYLNILREIDEDDWEQVRKTRVGMDRQVALLKRLIDDLMEVSRISQGKVSLKKTEVDINDLVRRVTENARSSAENVRGHNLYLSVSETPVVTCVDPTRIEQVVMNLLTNAIKYMDNGGTIWANVTATPVRVRISVRDTGIGISPVMLPKVFDLFSQAERSLEKAQGGMGVGLNLVKNLVEMHGGTVEVHSDGLGRGSEFIVYLPVVAAECCTGSGVRPALSDEKTKRAATALKIMIVDDNKEAADSLGQLLQMYGHEITTVGNGSEVEPQVRSYRPDVVLLDIGLPGMDGFDVCKLLRQKYGQTIRIIAVTGWGSEEHKRRGKRVGFELHLTKPVDPRELHAILLDPGTT